MANMGYIQFENTYRDLLDCFRSIETKNISDLSPMEQIFAKRLIELCEDVVRTSESYDFLVPDELED